MQDNHIFVVMGSSGSYDDWRCWPVCWRATYEEAEQMVGVMREQYHIYSKWVDEHKEALVSDRFYEEDYIVRSKMYDGRNISRHSDPVRYHAWAVGDEPGNYELLTHIVSDRRLAETNGMSFCDLIASYKKEAAEDDMAQYHQLIEDEFGPY